MPGYIEKLLARHKHVPPKHDQHSPYKAPPKKYGLSAQEPVPEDTTKRIDDKRLRKVQQVIEGILFYARAVDCTVLTALSSIASEQSGATEAREEKV